MLRWQSGQLQRSVKPSPERAPQVRILLPAHKFGTDCRWPIYVGDWIEALGSILRNTIEAATSIVNEAIRDCESNHTSCSQHPSHSFRVNYSCLGLYTF